MAFEAFLSRSIDKLAPMWYGVGKGNAMQGKISVDIQDYRLERRMFVPYGTWPSISHGGVIAIELYKNVIKKNIIEENKYAEVKDVMPGEYAKPCQSGQIIIDAGSGDSKTIDFTIDFFNTAANPGEFEVWEYDIRTKKIGSVVNYVCMSPVEALNHFSRLLGFKGVCRSPYFHMFVYGKHRSYLSIHPNTTPNRYAK